MADKYQSSNPFQKHRRLLSFVFFIVIYVIFITGSTYAFLNMSADSNTATGEGGCFEVSYSGENISSLSVVSSDDYQDGASTTVTISKDASCPIYTEASLYLHTNNTTTAPITINSALKYKIYRGSDLVANGSITEMGDVLLTSLPITNTSITYTIYLYVDSVISGGLFNDTDYSGYIYATSHQTSTIP